MTNTEPAEGETDMGQPVIHWEIAGADAEKLWGFYSEMFDWKIDANNPMKYGMAETGGGFTCRRAADHCSKRRQSRCTFAALLSSLAIWDTPPLLRWSCFSW